MQIYELRDNTIDQYIVLNPEKQIIGALAKEESYALQQRSSSNSNTNTPSTITPNQSNEAFNSINTSSNTTPPNSAITAVDYIGAFTYKVPTIINPLYADFKFLDFQNNPFATLNSALELILNYKNLLLQGMIKLFYLLLYQ